MKKLILLFITLVELHGADLVKPAYGLWGVGVNVTNNNYKDEPTRISVAPYIFGGYGDVSIEANRATYTLWGNGTFYTSAVAQLRTHQKSEKYDKKMAFELGGDVGLILPYGFVTRLALLADVTSTHQGYELDYQLFRHDTIWNVALLSAVGLQYQSKKLANYYYESGDYKPNESMVGELEFIATLPVYDFGIFVGTRSYWYDKGISGSPISQSNNTLQIFSGVGQCH